MSKKGYEVGSGKVFKDLGLPNAEEHLIKAQLVFQIGAVLKERGLKQVEAAGLLGHPAARCLDDAARRVQVVFRRATPAIPRGAGSGC